MVINSEGTAVYISSDAFTGKNMWPQNFGLLPAYYCCDCFSSLKDQCNVLIALLLSSSEHIMTHYPRLCPEKNAKLPVCGWFSLCVCNCMIILVYSTCTSDWLVAVFHVWLFVMLLLLLHVLSGRHCYWCARWLVCVKRVLVSKMRESATILLFSCCEAFMVLVQSKLIECYVAIVYCAVQVLMLIPCSTGNLMC